MSERYVVKVTVWAGRGAWHKPRFERYANGERTLFLGFVAVSW